MEYLKSFNNNAALVKNKKGRRVGDCRKRNWIWQTPR